MTREVRFWLEPEWMEFASIFEPAGTNEFIRGMPDPEYFGTKRMSQSLIKAGQRSPKHMYYSFKQTSEPNAGMEKGTVVHGVVLEPEKPQDQLYIVAPGGYTRRQKRWADWAAETPHLAHLTQEEHEACLRMIESILSVWVPPVRPQRELVAFWDDPVHGVAAKAKIDVLRDDIIEDIKTAKDASPDGFGRAAGNFGYHMQAWWYSSGVKAITGKDLPFRFIVVENEPPYDVAIYDVTEEQIQAGRKKIDAALSACAEAVKDPQNSALMGYPKRPVRLRIPRWAM